MKNSQNAVAVQLTDISKQYAIHHEKPTLVEKFYKGTDEKFWALNNINLTIQKGERVGIIGLNGSGKTTLLKIITGITTPTHGTVFTSGRIVSLIDLDAGFHEDLTGEQNIYLNGMLLGMKKEEIRSKLTRIIAFADIHQFIDVPLYTYSAGMKLRLGFSVAIYADPDILIIDENMGVGDESFREKTFKKIRGLYKQNKTVILVSHWTYFLKQNCTRIIKMNRGQIVR